MFRKQSSPIHDPVALRDALFAAAGSGNKAALSELCAVNRETIARHFGEWMNIGNCPGLDPKDNRKVQYVLNGLALTATVFRDELKDPSLWDRLAGPKETNPFRRFEEMFGRAKALAGEHRYDEAADLLTTHLIETKDLAGPGADHFRSFCHGLLGHCRFDANRAGDALDHYQQALSLCEAMGDAEGIGVYLATLFEAHRYLGQGEQAAA